MMEIMGECARPALKLPTDADPATRKLFRAFVHHGRITALPAKLSTRRRLLDHVAQHFEPGARYAETDVNAILRQLFDDYVTLRRYLVDEGFLDRADGWYWRSGGTVPI